jgi:hypothetical protein
MTDLHAYRQRLKEPVTVTIAAGAQNSTVANLDGLVACAIITPAAKTGDALSFLMAETENGTFIPVKDIGGNTLSVLMATNAAEYIQLPFDLLAGIRWLKLVSDAAEGAQRTFKIVARDAS